MKKIKGFPYTISTSGVVFSIRSGKVLQPYISNGYLKVDLYKNYKRRKVFVHQLIGECFHSSTLFTGAIINHKDGNRLNNSVENIEWGTYSHNNLHAYRVLGRKCPARRKGSESCNAIKINQLNLDGSFIKEWGSIVEAQDMYGQTIERCLSGKNKTSHGFKWKYA